MLADSIPIAGPSSGAPLMLILLPGLDGTGRLFAPFVRALPALIEPRVVSYPIDRALGYAELESLVARVMPRDRPFALLGESFSGPLALRLARARPPGLRAVVLVATFVRSPFPDVPAWLGGAACRWLFRLPPPAFHVRMVLAGPDGPSDLVRAVQAATAEPRPEVMAARVHSVLAADATDALRACAVPLLYLEGTEDRLVSRRHGVAPVLRARPDVVHVRLRAPHLVLQRRSDAAAAAIARFVLAQSGGAGESAGADSTSGAASPDAAAARRAASSRQ